MKRPIFILAAMLTVMTPAYATDVLGLKTVVIDPGHGGKDPGAVSLDRKTYEKDIVLDIAEKLASKIRAGFPDVNVILTRDSDVFIPLGIRADIANKANANLFISIHVNASRNTSASGFSVHVLGQSSNKGTDLYELNMASVMRENSVIRLEDDYSISYEGFNPSDSESYIFLQLMQNAYLEQSLSFAQMIEKDLSYGPVTHDRGIWQNPFLVLWRTSMPAVLIETGFISNSSDLSKLRTVSARETISDCLFKAFTEYKCSYDRSLDSEAPDPFNVTPEVVDAVRPLSEKPVETTTVPAVRFGIQIFAVKSRMNPDSQVFLGYEPEVFESGSLNKYVIAVSASLSEVESELVRIRKKYPDAFIVKIEGACVTKNH